MEVNMKEKKVFDITTRDRALKALQSLQLEILKELDRICRKHDIKYSLGGGTCLGQVRHGGFIPWDDDIDIDMTIENFEKFVEVAPLELDKNKYYLRCNKTNKKHLRSCSRLELKNTNISIKNWDKKKLNVGVFIDIFVWNYLPNNRYKRKIVSSLLFYIRCIQNYKMFGVCASKINPKIRTLFLIIAKLSPIKFIQWLEKKLINKYGKKKTNWIIDDAIINGNHGGYPIDGIDEYEDVYFEGIKVMNKKNSHNFMKTIYGENYTEWLPPVKRISHHKWTKASFGVYEPKFDLPDNYNDYLTIKYNIEKLEHMQKISFEMVEFVTKICKKNKLTCYLLDNSTYIKYKNVEECGKFWTGPMKIAMPREDYDKFAKIVQENLPDKYFYQTTETDPEYKYPYARIRLNYTLIREARIPKIIEEKYNNGFFVKLIPLDNTSDNIKKRKKHYKKIRYLNHFIYLKWTKNNFRAFIKGNYKRKIKLILLLPFSVEFLKKKLDKISGKYNEIDTGYYVDGTGYQLKGKIFAKNILGEGKTLKYNNYSFVFPSQLEEYCESIYKNKLKNEVDKLSFIKHEFFDSYEKYKDKMFTKKINKIQKKFPACYLNYFDLPEYQLTVLRYDEKKDEFLSNEEIFKNN